LHLNAQQCDFLTDSIVKLAGDTPALSFLCTHEATGELDPLETQGFAIMYVETTSDIPNKCAIVQKPWRAIVADPSILTVVSPQTVLHSERQPSVKGFGVDFQAVLQVVWMDTIRPSVSDLLFDFASGKFEPASIEACAEFVDIRHPHHDRGGINQCVKALFAFSEDLFRTANFSDIK
jgi:hypothetical protein